MRNNSNENAELRKLTSEIVAAYAGNNAVASAQLSDMIGDVFNKLSDLGKPAPEPDPVPAVPIKKSITKETIRCLECGRPMKMLKRHLKCHKLLPDEYRAKWRLNHDYPMVTANYSKVRSKLAINIGLGRNPKK